MCVKYVMGGSTVVALKVDELQVIRWAAGDELTLFSLAVSSTWMVRRLVEAPIHVDQRRQLEGYDAGVHAWEFKHQLCGFFSFHNEGSCHTGLSIGGNLNYTCIHSTTTATFKVTTFLILKACAGVTFISFYQYGRQYYKEVKLPYEKKKKKKKSSEPSINRALFWNSHPHYIPM